MVDTWGEGEALPRTVRSPRADGTLTICREPSPPLPLQLLGRKDYDPAALSTKCATE